MTDLTAYYVEDLYTILVKISVPGKAIAHHVTLVHILMSILLLPS